jgi:hypothetical protein
MVAGHRRALGESPEATEGCPRALCHGLGACELGSAAAATSRLIRRTVHRSRNKVDVDLHPRASRLLEMMPEVGSQVSSSGVLVFDQSSCIDWRTINLEDQILREQHQLH